MHEIATFLLALPLAWLASLTDAKSTSPSLAPSPPADVAVPARAVYVSPSGDDEADGHDPSKPFRSFERAEQAVLRGARTVFLLDGTHRRRRAFTINPVGWSQRWTAAPGSHPIVDGGGTTDSAFLINGHDVQVDGLTITNFTANGIVIGSADRIIIRNNNISKITSKSWTTAGIMVIQSARDVTIKENFVHNTGYVGIGSFASKDGDLRQLRIIGNRLAETCQIVVDCGAIYLTGRPPQSRGAIIHNNIITNYGPPNHETKAIYLDDGLSGADVSGNTIKGSGTYALHIHGGNDNIIKDNIIELRLGEPILFHQEFEGAAAKALTGNAITGNSIRLHRPDDTLNVKYGGFLSKPVIRGNRIARR